MKRHISTWFMVSEGGWKSRLSEKLRKGGDLVKLTNPTIKLKGIPLKLLQTMYMYIMYLCYYSSESRSSRFR